MASVSETVGPSPETCYLTVTMGAGDESGDALHLRPTSDLIIHQTPARIA